jgi:hypothetical protein
MDSRTTTPKGISFKERLIGKSRTKYRLKIGIGE